MNKGKSYNSNNKIQPKYRILSFIFALIMFFGSFLQDITVFAKVQDSDFKLVDNVEMDDESSLDYNSKRNIDVQIVWNENFHQNVKKPKSVTIKLFEDNKDAKRILELTEDNGWKGTFDELYVYNAKGQKINYTIDEVDVPNYNKLIRGNQDEGFTVANTYWPEKVSFEVQKKWFSNYNLKEEGKKRPDHVIIELLENKNPTGNTIKLELANEWKYGFWDLPKYDENNNEIIYTIREFEIEGYKTRIYGDSE